MLDILFPIVLLAFSILTLIGVLWAVADLLMSSRDTGEKILWMLVILFVPFGFVLYFLLA